MHGFFSGSSLDLPDMDFEFPPFEQFAEVALGHFNSRHRVCLPSILCFLLKLSY